MVQVNNYKEADIFINHDIRNIKWNILVFYSYSCFDHRVVGICLYINLLKNEKEE